MAVLLLGDFDIMAMTTMAAEVAVIPYLMTGSLVEVVLLSTAAPHVILCCVRRYYCLHLVEAIYCPIDTTTMTMTIAVALAAAAAAPGLCSYNYYCCFCSSSCH